MYQVGKEEMRALSARQPALLVISLPTIKAGLITFANKLGRSTADTLEVLVDDPSTFAMFGYMDAVVEQWGVRLGLEPSLVARLVTEQPALLEMAPNTVKARLESLAALFSVPLHIAAQLVSPRPH